MKRFLSGLFAIILALTLTFNVAYAQDSSTQDISNLSVHNAGYDSTKWLEDGEYFYYIGFDMIQDLQEGKKTERIFIESPFNTILEFKYPDYTGKEELFYMMDLVASYAPNRLSYEVELKYGTYSLTTYGAEGQRKTPFHLDFINEVFRYKKIDESATDFTLVKDLPATTANTIGTVRYSITGFNMIMSITYDQMVYHVQYRFDAHQDMEVFESIESYFMNVEDTPQVIINNSDKPYLRDILEAPDNEKPAFVPHTIWDLKSNVIKTQETYTTNVYLKQSEEGLLISYVYIDEYIIDNILSANVRWTSRQKNNFVNSIFLGKYTEWETQTKTFVEDEYFNYRDLTSNWQNWIPYWNIARGIYQLNKTYQIPRMNGINVNNIPKQFNINKNEVESHFRTVNDDFDYFNSNPRYKLWAFVLQEGKDFQGTKTEFYDNPLDDKDERNFKIMQINYQTDGEIYTAVGDDMDLRIKVDPYSDGLKNEEGRTWQDMIMIVVYLVVGILVINIFISSGAFKSPKHMTRVLITVLLFAGVVFIIYWFATSGFITQLATIRLRL